MKAGNCNRLPLSSDTNHTDYSHKRFLKPSSKNNEISAKCANASFNLKHPSINILFFSYLDTNTNTNLVILTSLLSLLELVLQVSKFLADLVQHLVKSPVLGIVLVKLRLVSYTLLC